jgi:hypothetical protein
MRCSPSTKGPNETGPRVFAGAGDVQRIARELRAWATKAYGFSTGSRTAFPHSVHDPS